MSNKKLTDAEREHIDAEVRRVMAGREQVKRMEGALDMTLGLLFPSWSAGGHVYDPDSGEFIKKGGKLPKSAYRRA